MHDGGVILGGVAAAAAAAAAAAVPLDAPFSPAGGGLMAMSP
jgi:hypothetical protein